MRTAFRPLPLLLRTQAFAHHLVHRRLHEPRGDGFTVTIPLAIMRHEVAVVRDGGTECFHGFEERLALWIRLFEGVNPGLEVINFVQGFEAIVMPQGPLQPLDLLPHLLTHHLVTVHETFAVLVQYRQSHREGKPIHNVLGFWAQRELEIADGVAAVREQRARLIALEPWRLQDLVQAPLRWSVHGLHEAQALAGGYLLVLIACDGERALADDDLEVRLLRLPIAPRAPVDAPGDGPIREGSMAPILPAALDATPLFFPPCRFTALGPLQGIMAYRLDVQCHLERQEVCESSDRHAL